jgi:predicted transcriptional regulator of viral defense system
MSKITDTPATKFATLSTIAASQWALITTAQAEAAGLSRLQHSRYVSRGMLIRLEKGVYRIAGAMPSEYEPIEATWLSTNPIKTAQQRVANPDVIVGGTTAAYLWECGDMQPYPYEFYTKERRQTKRGSLLYLRKDFDRAMIGIVDGLPVAKMHIVIDDLNKRNFDPSLIEDIEHDAKHKGLL